MNLFRTPMMESSPKQEALECLIIFGAVALIMLIGQIVYQMEEKHDRDNRRSKARGMDNKFDKAVANGKHRQKLGKARKGRTHNR